MGYSQPQNDSCHIAIELPVDGMCYTYSNVGATNSSNPYDGLNCGHWNAGHGDVWFKSVVPSSGNLTIEASESVGGGLSSIDIEVYSGDCNALQILSCSDTKDQFDNILSFGKIELEGLTEGDTVFIRAISSNGNTGDFDICVSDIGYNYPCKIDYIEVGLQTSCDPSTNTYNQELTVHYRTDGSANQLYVAGTIFTVTGSPQTVTLNDLPANGGSVNMYSYLRFNNNYDECVVDSRYYAQSLFATPLNCYSGVVVNDECEGAIMLEVGDKCNEYIGDNTGATLSAGVSSNFSCFYAGNYPQDVWYKFIIPASGDVVVNTYTLGAVAPVFEIYKNSCGDLSLINGGCGFVSSSYRMTDGTSGDTLYVRVADSQGDDQGEFGICVFEAEPFMNDICVDAIDVTINSSDAAIYSTHLANAEEYPTSTISCDSGNPSKDVWFKVEDVSGRISIETVEVERGSADKIMEVFTGDCNNLSLLDCDDVSGSNVHPRVDLENLQNANLYIRVAQDGFGEASFGMRVTQLANDFCSEAIFLASDDSCHTYTTDGSSNSGEPGDGLSCGFWNEGHGDVWFKSVVPNSGNIRVETYQPSSGGLTDVDIELFSGTCGSLQPITCSNNKERYNGFDRHARIEQEGLEVGDTVYIRIIAPFGSQGDFDICVSDEGFAYTCRVERVELGTQSSCDPNTNTYSQEFIVHYRNEGGATGMHINGQQFPLIGSPQTVTVNNLNASGSNKDVRAYLFQSLQYESSECRLNSTFEGDNFYVSPVNCYSGLVDNDECKGAIWLTLGESCTENIGDNTGATLSSEVNPLFNCFDGGNMPQDIWYRFEVPSSGDIVINAYTVSSVLPVFEIYEGSCGMLTLLEPNCGSWSQSIRLTNRAPEDTLYIRVADLGGDDQGEFGICLFEAEPSNNDICSNAVELELNSSDTKIYSTHFANAEENPTATISCDSGNPSKDVWFKVEDVSGTINIETVEVERGFADMIMEIFSGDCNNLTLLGCDDFSGLNLHSKIELEDLENVDLYIRVSEDGSYPDLSFGIRARLIIPPPNDICTDAILLENQGCQVFNNTDATASMNPTPGVVCDNSSPSLDTWFKVVMPGEGMLTIQTQQVVGGLSDPVMEAYVGDCSSLTYLACDDFGGNNSHALLRIEDVPEGDTIYIRIADDNNNDFGEFQVCQSFIDRSSCYIDSIIPLSQVCDPPSNTYTQEIKVYYQANDSVDRLRVDLYEVGITEFFDLTGSPMTISIDSIYAIGLELDHQFLLQDEDRSNDCVQLSYRRDTIVASESCYNGEGVENDNCLNAILLDITSYCDMRYFNNTGATPSLSQQGIMPYCDDFRDELLPDMWFKFVQPFSEILQMDLEFVSSYPITELYSGSCNNLEFVSCDIFSEELIPGETYYIRAYDGGVSRRQGEFGICLTSYCPDEEYINYDLSNGYHRFQNHINIAADNIINSNSSVIYDAGSSIELLPGFQVKKDSEFSAIIDGCQDELVACPIDEHVFQGAYNISYVGDASRGFGIPFSTAETVELIPSRFNNTRHVELEYLPNFGGFPVRLELDFGCSEVTIPLNDTNVGCNDGTIKIIGAHIDGYNVLSSYNINDDSQFTIHLIDYYQDGGCGIPPILKTMVFTKVTP